MKIEFYIHDIGRSFKKIQYELVHIQVSAGPFDTFLKL